MMAARRAMNVTKSFIAQRLPEGGARCVSSARRDLCGGRGVILVPTATIGWTATNPNGERRFPALSRMRYILILIDQPEGMIAMHTNPFAPLLDIVLQRTQRSGIGRRAILAGAAALVCAAALEPHRNVWAQASASAPASGAVTLFENVRIFDGKGAALSTPSNVLIRGNVIERISTQPIPVDRRADTRIIDGGGRTLMPGLIDVHWHAMMVRVTPAQAFVNAAYNNLVAGAERTDR